MRSRNCGRDRRLDNDEAMREVDVILCQKHFCKRVCEGSKMSVWRKFDSKSRFRKVNGSLINFKVQAMVRKDDPRHDFGNFNDCGINKQTN